MKWLAAHADSPGVAAPTRSRVAWLTGQSSWRHSLLSPAQQAVLDALADDGFDPLGVGFPWTARAMVGTYRPEPLARAAVRNGAQFLAARWGSGRGAALRPEAFPRQVARHLQQLVDLTEDRLMLLVGSAGAEMLTAAAALIQIPDELIVDVVALGPVGRLPGAAGRAHAAGARSHHTDARAPGQTEPRTSPWRIRVVQGAEDRISQWGYRGPVDVIVPGGHLRAATSPAAVTAIRSCLAGATR